MSIEELTEIVKKTDLREIKRALKATGFMNCKRSRKFRRASLYDIATAPYEKTLYFPDGKGNEYVGDLCRDVKGYEKCEFVILQFLAPYKRGREKLSTKKMLIFAREII